MKAKICSKCQKEKNIDDFYKNESKCKECILKRQKEYRKDNKTKISERNKIYAKSEKGKGVQRKYNDSEKGKSRGKRFSQTIKGKAGQIRVTNNQFKKHPERLIALNTVRNALRKKEIEKQSCIICNDINVEAHHPNYDFPLKIIWLCIFHHKALHKINRFLEKVKIEL